MNEKWLDAVITGIHAAVYVPPDSGTHIHKNRPFHGFVLNDSHAVKDYLFDDGRVMRTGANSLFYLPAGSSYYVRLIERGGCYAINFYADISDEPFCIDLRNVVDLKKNYKEACHEWKKQDPSWHALAMRALYDTVAQIKKETEQDDVPKEKMDIISVALNEIDSRFSDTELSVEYLAEQCGISEVYLRRIFASKFGMSPKEYIIKKRIEYAKQLIKSEQFDIFEVAVLCGFGEPCHFSRTFKKHVGLSPKEYK